MTSSGSSIICRSLDELNSRHADSSSHEPVRVHGATPSAQALLVLRVIEARLAQSRLDPIVILCADDDVASEFAGDVESLAAALDLPSPCILQFPTWEQSPYSPIAPSIRTRLARVAALSTLASGAGGRVPVLFTTIAALSQATLPHEEFIRYSLKLETGQSVESRERLIQRLLEAGYLRVDPVEDPGNFAVRGDIIDVYPPDRDQPLRIELFGDEIERIREFDPATQRTASPEVPDLQVVTVPPAREVLINSVTTSRVREKVKARADDRGVPRPVRDPVMASIHSGNYPDHSDAWAPLAYENPATLLDYLNDGATTFWVDELSILQRWDEHLDEQKRLSSESDHPELILPAVEELYQWSPSAEKKVRSQSILYLDRVQLADLESLPQGDEDKEAAALTGPKEPEVSSRHTVFVRGNQDLARGTKHSLGELEAKFKLWVKQGFKIITLASTQSQLERIRYLLEEHQITTHAEAAPGRVALKIGSLSAGFRWPAEGLVILVEDEILGAKHKKKQRRASTAQSGSAAKDWSGLQALSDLAVGDAIVHLDHGIGKYQGLVRLSLSGAPSDFLQLEYANKDKLYLPVYRLNVIQKYSGGADAVSLDRLGSQTFARTKEKVRDAVRKIAIDLVKLYAERKIRPGHVFSGRDSLFQEFEARFPFDETPDQLKAIDQVLDDMQSGRVMDRLICGDVGYGKTEVAIRAAFRAVSDGKQVVVLVPTTVLAFQHEQNFKARMKDYPINIESVSRFKTAKEQKTILEGVAKGKIDIIIGTHRLLSKDVSFNDLGLVIVDEEHRFGVEHKERLKTLRTNIHVVTLTATPIPRTLHMALSGLRDISLINTPPVDRLPIRTYVSKLDDALVQKAINYELNRGGQVFVLHNRVQSIHELAKRIKELVPTANIGVGHGQMGEGELEKTMLDFYQKRTNVLVSTTIIESGLDVPSANTIIINRADSLGLAQLYQIRGRVGRGQQRAYAYLLIPAEGAVTEDAKRRLEVIQRFVELGSGFSIASHDLEIRGGGDLLGPQQSGHIAAVGFDLYTEILEEAIQEIEGSPQTAQTQTRREPEIKLPFAAFLGEEYVPDIHQRLSLYRRFSATTQEGELDALEEELRDRFGPLPPEAQNLLWMIRLKQLLVRSGIDSLTAGPEKVSMIIGSGSAVDPVKAISVVAGDRTRYQLTPDPSGPGHTKLVAKVPTGTLRDLYFAIESLLKKLTGMAA
ncbi:MAG: transcription-repair coupling factor [Bdellovibrionia bacterium]